MHAHTRLIHPFHPSTKTPNETRGHHHLFGQTDRDTEHNTYRALCTFLPWSGLYAIIPHLHTFPYPISYISCYCCCCCYSCFGAARRFGMLILIPYFIRGYVYPCFCDCTFHPTYIHRTARRFFCLFLGYDYGYVHMEEGSTGLADGWQMTDGGRMKDGMGWQAHIDAQNWWARYNSTSIHTYEL